MNQNDILLDDKNLKTLHQISKEVAFPLSKSEKRFIRDALKYLELSQDDTYAQINNIRAGMGLAYVQLGILKRIFVISYKKEDGTFEEYTIINPKLVSHSEEMIYVEEGEGCLSVNRYVDGIVPRYARITVEYYNEEGKLQTVRVREEMAVAFQHEMDHLDGIMFTDKIDNKNPYKNKDLMRAI